MRQLGRKITIFFLIAVCAIAGLFIRSRSPHDGSFGILLPVLSVLFPICLAVVIVRLPVQAAAPDARNRFFQLPVALAAVLLAVGNLMRFKESDELFPQIVFGIAALGAVLLFVLCTLSLFSRRGSFFLLLPLCIGLALCLIHDYKGWSRDPLLANYCYHLLADICAMLAAYHIGGFYCGAGKRRLTVFWSGCAIFFCCVCLADAKGDFPTILHLSGLLLWFCAAVLRLVLPEAPQEEVADA